MKKKYVDNFFKLLKENVTYDSVNGTFIRNVTGGGARKGSSPGHKNKGGYLIISILGKSYLAHRLAWMYVYEEFPDKFIDHINGIRDDNRIINLRKASNAENMQNLKSHMRDSETGLLGVVKNKRDNNYKARICINYKTTTIGTFNTAIEAHQAYLDKKRQLHPFSTL